MGIYTFKVYCKMQMDLHDHLITIGPGEDVFTAQTEDLASFKELLHLGGVVIREVNQVDTLEPAKEFAALEFAPHTARLPSCDEAMAELPQLPETD